MNQNPPIKGQALDATAYFSLPEWADNVEYELGRVDKRYGQLFLRQGPAVACHWAQNIWLEPRIITFSSAKNAVEQLVAWFPRWQLYGEILPALRQEITSLLPKTDAMPLAFPVQALPKTSGSCALLDAHTLLASARCTSPFPGGKIEFRENRKQPPSSAYLKLWEALTRLGRHPQPLNSCLDAGACPGGWTWVFDTLGASVLALDRSPLDPRLMASPRVKFRSGNAFAVTPQNLGEFGFDKLDWLCSDLICYPDKLLEWVRLWLDSGKVANFVVTLKMQGQPDWASIAAFAAIPQSLVYHGSYNKHELTWIHPIESGKAGAG